MSMASQGQQVRAGMEVGHVKSSDGSQVSMSDTICVISPAQQDMWEALCALLIVGDAEDVEAFQANTDRYATKPQIIEQAKETCKAIEKRVRATREK